MRTRKPVSNVNLHNGSPIGGGSAQLGDKIPDKNPQNGPPVNPLQVFGNDTDPKQYLIDNPTDPLGTHLEVDTTPIADGGSGGSLALIGADADLKLKLVHVKNNEDMN